MPADERIKIFHNPACSKSRGALEILRSSGAEFDVVEYLRSPLDESGIRHLLGLIPDPPQELVRKDRHFKELGLASADYADAESVARLLAENPKLMQRPVVVKGDRALIARPSEKVEELL